MKFVNSDVHTRAWNSLTNPETGRTLQLAPGEEVELDEDPNDVFLKPVRATKSASGAGASTQSEKSDETTKE